jgi:choline dehydrogenase
MRPDIVIVGAGSSGCVLAARLTEDPSIHVLLLESGTDYPAESAPEAMRSANPARIIHNPQYHYPNLTASRTDLQPPSLFWRGRGAGGSSSINGQLALRGIPSDFDGWNDKLGGDAGWGYGARRFYT